MNLLAAAKVTLRIEDNDSDLRLELLIQEGIAYIDAKIGGKLDYSATGAPRRLLLHYIRYAYNDASEFFEEYFKVDILTLQLEYAACQAKLAAKNEGGAGSDD